MLGFILSKMQMLLFAVGIAVVALLFYNFVSGIGLSEAANNLITTDTKLISDQINVIGSSSFATTSIPDTLSVGTGSNSFYYDLEFAKSIFGAGTKQQNVLTVRVLQHISSTRAQASDRQVISAKSIGTQASIILIDPGFLGETTGLECYYDKQKITLYPRAKGATPNGFAVVKEVKEGEKFLYIIPCTSTISNNCFDNIVRVGCYKLKLRKQSIPDMPSTTQVDSAFNITTTIDSGSAAIGSGGYVSTTSHNYSWEDCTRLFPEITNPVITSC